MPPQTNSPPDWTSSSSGQHEMSVLIELSLKKPVSPSKTGAKNSHAPPHIKSRSPSSPARAALHKHLFGDKRMACADFRKHRDNIDCRHIGHLTPHEVQAMELAKNVKRTLTNNGHAPIKKELSTCQSLLCLDLVFIRGVRRKNVQISRCEQRGQIEQQKHRLCTLLHAA